MKNPVMVLGLCLLAVMMAFPLQAKDKFLKSKGQELRYREAIAYVNNAQKRDIIVGVEALSKAEQKRLLGSRTGKYAALEVAITNNSRFRLYLNAIDFAAAGQQLPIAAVSLDAVAKVTTSSGKGNKKGMRMSILRNHLIDNDLRSRIILPGETVQGIVFMGPDARRADARLHVDIQNLKRLVYLDILVPVNP